MWFILILPFFQFDQANVDKISEYMRLHYADPAPVFNWQARPGLIPHMPRFNRGKLPPNPGRSDILIGDTPAETLYITGNFFNEGNIFVFNDGVLRIKNADFNLNGDMYVYGGGKVTADSSALNIIQYYIYHHAIVLTDSGKFFIADCNTGFNGYQISIAVTGKGEIRMNRVTNRDWITAGLYQNGRAILDRVGITGEWLFSNNCYARFNRVNNLLTWYFFEDGSNVTINFPEGDSTWGFYIDSTRPGVSGVNYHVEIDTSSNVMWASIPLTGSMVIIDSSTLRTTGLMFNNRDSITGLVNNLHYQDWTLPVGDRIFRLRNTTIQTWNLYPAESSFVEVRSSIFGELCAYEYSFATILNSFCDGSGGHIEASGNATNFCFLSSLSCDVIAKNRGLLVLGYTAMTMGNIWATGASIMIIVNSQFPEDPVPSDTAIVFVAGITGPSSARVNDTFPVFGSAWIDPGPYNPQDFRFYQLFYRPTGDSTWIPIGDSLFTETRHAALDYWNTVGLAEGPYDVRLILKDLTGDSIEALKQITLRILGQSEAVSGKILEPLTVRSMGTRLLLIENRLSNTEIRIHDILGRVVGISKRDAFYWSAPAAGIYFIGITGFNITKKVVVY